MANNRYWRACRAGVRELLRSSAAALMLVAAAPGAGAVGEHGSLWRFGTSTALSGPAEHLGREMVVGLEAGFSRGRRGEGLERPYDIELVAMDDGYEPAQTVPNMRRLVHEEQVLAVVGNVGTPTAVVAQPIATENRTLFFAPFTGAGFLRPTPPERYLIHYRASYREEIAAMVRALVHHGGLEPREIGFFTQNDSYGNAGFAAGIEALNEQGLVDPARVSHGRYVRNTLAVENAVADLLLADPVPRAVILVGAYGPCARFIRLARAAGLDAAFLSVSFVGGSALARELGPAGEGVVVTQVVPHPENTALPLVAEYHRDLQAAYGAIPPSFVSLEGYVAARILLRAMGSVTGPASREGLIRALEGLGEFDLGLGTVLRLGSASHQASHQVWPTVLREGQVAPFLWRDVGQLLGGP